VRNSLPKKDALALIRFGNFFQCKCSKVINPKELKILESEIVEVFCELESIFHQPSLILWCTGLFA